MSAHEHGHGCCGGHDHGDSMEPSVLICASPQCGKPASKLQCPTCIKLEISDSYFCNQQCFAASWSTHKKLHLAKKALNAASQSALANSLYRPWPSYEFTGPLRPYTQTPRRPVPELIACPDYVFHPGGVSLEEKEAKMSSQIKVLTDEEIEGLRLSCRLGREVLNEAAKACDIGVTTDEIDRIVHEACVERECYPSPLGYYQFPKSCCTSVNEVICHGIPDLRPMENGDIMNVDVTVYHRGFHGDLNETFIIGDKVDEASLKLIKSTHECLSQAIKIVKPGTKFRDIGAVIQKHAQANGLSVVRTYCGHGIHRLFHTVPNIPHYAMSYAEMGIWHMLGWIGLENKAMGVMKAGNSFTIEPMINIGTHNDEQWPDNWTAVTKDGKRSAQFEQTLLVTDDGCEVLTGRTEFASRPWFVDQMEKWNIENRDKFTPETYH